MSTQEFPWSEKKILEIAKALQLKPNSLYSLPSRTFYVKVMLPETGTKPEDRIGFDSFLKMLLADKVPFSPKLDHLKVYYQEE